jgi:hypothetical protein
MKHGNLWADDEKFISLVWLEKQDARLDLIKINDSEFFAGVRIRPDTANLKFRLIYELSPARLVSTR